MPQPHKPSILVVDDEPPVRAALRRSLSLYGDVVVACDPGQALTWLEERSFDLIITDYMMPEMTGLALLDEVARGWPGVRRVLMSGSPPDGVEQMAAEGQVIEAFLPKPWSPEELERILAALGRRRTPLPVRRERRVPVRVPVSAQPDDDGPPAELESADLSAGGIFVGTPRPAPVGTGVSLRIRTPWGVDVHVRGRVAHVVPDHEARRTGRGPGMGVQFTELHEPVREALDRMLDLAHAELSDRLLPSLSVRDPGPTPTLTTEARYTRALAHLAGGRTDDAVALLSQACQERPGEARYAARLELALARQCAARALANDALGHYRRALEFDPTCHEAVRALRAHQERTYSESAGSPP